MYNEEGMYYRCRLMAEGGAERIFYRVEIDSTVWEVPKRYQELKSKGSGAFGTVWYVIVMPHPYFPPRQCVDDH